MTDTFLQYQLSQLCQNAIQTCPFTNPVAGADCTKKFCTGFPAYISVGTCVTLGDDPHNCCTSSDPTSCLQNFAHGSGSGSGSGAPNVCASAISILDTCFTLTPSLSPSAGSALATNGPGATALASCACYDSNGAYVPAQFDGFASDCQASGSAAHPTYFPLVTPLVGLCTNYASGGGGGGGSSSMDMTTTAASAAAGSSQAGSGAGSMGASSSAAATATATATAAGGQSAATATTGAGAGSSASSPSAQTTTSKSGAGKITIRTSAILLLGFGVLVSFY